MHAFKYDNLFQSFTTYVQFGVEFYLLFNRPIKMSESPLLNQKHFRGENNYYTCVEPVAMVAVVVVVADCLHDN